MSTENDEILSKIEEILVGKTIKSVGSFNLRFPSVTIYFTDDTHLDLRFSAYNPMPVMRDEEYELEVDYKDLNGNVILIIRID